MLFLSRPRSPARHRGASAGALLSLACAAVLIFISAAPRPLAARELVIEMFRSSFLPEAITIELGDTVRWERISGEHTVTSGRPDGAPGTHDEPGALFDVVLDESNPSFSYTFTEFREEGFLFFDRRNPTQTGFIKVSSGEIVFRVAVVDNVFIPDFAAIFEGDTILWEHEPMEAFHTVTSGLSSRPEDNPGTLFDEESSDARPIFSYRFERAGDYPYFCRPHEHLDMKGMILVQRTFVRADVTGEGTVDISDPIATLGFLFLGNPAPSCQDGADANDDGNIDLSDAVYTLNFLFSGGGPIPAPYPRAGGDRTEDTLLCR